MGKLRRNRRKGNAKLGVEVPGPGSLGMSGKGLMQLTRSTAKLETLILPIDPDAKTRKRLKNTGKSNLKLTLTYMPSGGTAHTENLTVRLLEKLTH